MIKKKKRGFLYWLVEFMIKHDLFTHHGKFKVGDLVMYNWKAYTYVYSAIERRDKGIKKIARIDLKPDYATFEDEDGCNVFWIRKAYWWERRSYNKKNK